MCFFSGMIKNTDMYAESVPSESDSHVIITWRYFMRRLLICLFSFALILSGCVIRRNDSGTAAQTAYEGYYKAIEDNERFIGRSLYYTISAQMSNMPDGTHRYYVFLDNAQVSMYDVTMMAVENDVPFEDSKKMMPSVGIFDSRDYSLIPYQANADAGYVKGLVLGGECEEKEVKLKLMVEWKDRNRERITREYISMVLTTDGFIYPSELLVEPVPESTAEPSALPEEGTDEH